MAFKAEYVPQTEWAFYNSLDIRLKDKHIRANEFSKWAKDKQRGRYLIEVCPYRTDFDSYWPGVYLLIDGDIRVYFEVSRLRKPWTGDIKQVIAPPTYQIKDKELKATIDDVAQETIEFWQLIQPVVSDGSLDLITEYAAEKDWAFFNGLNIRFDGRLIMAGEYSRWTVNKDRNIYFLCVREKTLNNGPVYLLIWNESRIYLDVTPISRRDFGKAFYCWTIWRIQAPKALENQREELLEIIPQVANSITNYKNFIEIPFVIDGIAEPDFVDEGEIDYAR